MRYMVKKDEGISNERVSRETTPYKRRSSVPYHRSAFLARSVEKSALLCVANDMNKDKESPIKDVALFVKPTEEEEDKRSPLKPYNSSKDGEQSLSNKQTKVLNQKNTRKLIVNQI